MLDIVDLEKRYPTPSGELIALESISLKVDLGETVAVHGPSGSGKTTLLLAAGGLLSPDKGRVTVDGQDVYALSPEERAKLRSTQIGFVFQQFHLVPYLNVLENVLVPSAAVDIPDSRKRAEELLERFDMLDRALHVPAELSTGEKQRAALARALIAQPKIILADEPTGNLDEGSAQAVLGYLAEFASDGGCVLLVTHDPQSANYAKRTIPLERKARHAAPVGE